MDNRFSHYMWGLMLILAGVVMAGNVMGIWSFSLFFDGWWTLFIIVPCLLSMLQSGVNGGNLFGLGFGVLLLLSAQDFLPWGLSWKLFLPIMLIWIGVTVMLGGRLGRSSTNWARVNEEGLLNYTAVFSGQTIRYAPDPFPGASLFTMFGGIDLDLRNAIIEQDIYVKTSAIFGGSTIIVPSNVNIKASSTPIFGGLSNKTQNRYDASQPTLYVNSLNVFGGTDLKS